MASNKCKLKKMATNIMKNIFRTFNTLLVLVTMGSVTGFTQAVNEERMRRDIEVAENVLSTLIKQEMEQQRTFFGLDVKGSYQPGYGVTFRVPDQSMPFVFTINGDDVHGATVIANGNTYEYSYRTNSEGDAEVAGDDRAIKLKDKTKERKLMSVDSIRNKYNERIVSAAQNFILDYGDFISQLGPNEKIVVTNQSDHGQFVPFKGNRTRISVEGTRADVTSLRQGKFTRDQALKRLSVVNTESVESKEPDMEMLSSIFSRLYRPDLSKTYFLEGNVYYERLKDFGAIFYMRVVSSDETGPARYIMPTLRLENLDQQTRDKKVKELYPAFEQDMKENIVEYGRTVKSLKDNESLIFNITMTQCRGCGIPSTLELSVKGASLKDYGAGKIDKSEAMNKIQMKKGASQ
jgi:hypothetical protein